MTKQTPDELDPIARELERYAQLTAGETSPGLSDRVMSDLVAEQTPRRGLLAWLLGTSGAGGATRLVMVAGTMALAVLAVVIAGQLGDLLRDPQIGPSPSAPAIQTPTATPSATPSASPTPSATPTTTPSPTSSTTAPSPTASDDDQDATPEPSEDDNSGPGGDDGPETPEPSDDSSDSGGGDDSSD